MMDFVKEDENPDEENLIKSQKTPHSSSSLAHTVDHSR